MKMFSGARIKLMATYTAILMIISIAFSVVIGVIATQEIRRPFDSSCRNAINWQRYVS